MKKDKKAYASPYLLVLETKPEQLCDPTVSNVNVGGEGNDPVGPQPPAKPTTVESHKWEWDEWEDDFWDEYKEKD
ncbi:MAG: hypothetical protein ILA04_03460 [Prevotella sp.]|nr:hypothetical protein [Prevotella sp.]